MTQSNPALKCPRCGLINDPDALRCDCGFDFKSRTVRESYDSNQTKAPSTPVGIVGCILALIGALMGFFFLTTRSLVAVPSRLLTPGNPFNFLWILFFGGLAILGYILYREHKNRRPPRM